MNPPHTRIYTLSLFVSIGELLSSDPTSQPLSVMLSYFKWKPNIYIYIYIYTTHFYEADPDANPSFKVVLLTIFLEQFLACTCTISLHGQIFISCTIPYGSSFLPSYGFTKSAMVVEYTDCFSAEGWDPPTSLQDRTLNNLMLRFWQC